MDPLVKPLSGGQLLLWHVEGDVTDLARACTAQEQARAEGFVSESRRREWLGWRALVHRTKPGVEITYTAQGAPQLSDGTFLSVSHAAGWVAVLFGEEPCGVDIERLDRNFERVARRYIGPDEQLLPQAEHPHFKALLWSAKEALYKWAGVEGADLIRDVKVRALDLQAQTLHGAVCGRSVTLHCLMHDGLCVVSCIG